MPTDKSTERVIAAFTSSIGMSTQRSAKRFSSESNKVSIAGGKFNNSSAIGGFSKNESVNRNSVEISTPEDFKLGKLYLYDNVYCVDPEDNAVLNLANKHIRGIDEGLNFLQSVSIKPDNSEQYIFINEALYYFYKSPDLFVNEFQRISSIPNIHIYCTTTRPELLNELFCSLFENRASFFLTSTRASKILFGSNAGVSTFDGEITISRDFGQTSTTNVIQIG